MPKFPEVFFLLFLLSPLSAQACTPLQHLAIVEIQISGEQPSQDYVKIYNPTSQVVNLGGYQLRKKTRQGKTYSIKVFSPEQTIPPKGFFIWANAQNHFAELIKANSLSQATLSINNSVALLDKQKNIIDSVSWGDPTLSFSPGKPFPQNPQEQQILKRKHDENCFLDSDDNSVDFYLNPDLTSHAIPDNLVLGTQTPQSSSKWLGLGLGGGFGLLSVVLVLLLEKKL